MQTIDGGNTIRESVQNAHQLAKKTRDSVAFRWGSSTIIVTPESKVEIQFPKESSSRFAVSHSIKMAQRLQQNVSFQFGGTMITVEPQFDQSDFIKLVEQLDR